jgi:hypothetical protein
MVDYGPPPAGLYAFGIDNLPSFAALTSVPNRGVAPIITVDGPSPAESMNERGEYGSYFSVGPDIYARNHQPSAGSRRDSVFSGYSSTGSGTTGSGSVGVLGAEVTKVEASAGEAVGGIY